MGIKAGLDAEQGADILAQIIESFAELLIISILR